MRILLPLATLALALATVPAPASATANDCVSIDGNVECSLVAVSVFGSSTADVAASGTGDADGAFAAASGTGRATTYMDRCLEWICPSVAVAGYDDAHAECRASSVCVAVAGKGHATHEGFGYSVGGCDLLYHVCYPIREAAPLLP